MLVSMNGHESLVEAIPTETQLLTGLSMHSRKDCSAATQTALPTPEEAQQATVDQISSS